MIIAVEGPDLAGKSTLVAGLRVLFPEARFVAAIPYAKEVMPVMAYVEARAVALWTSLYDESQFYICDRSVFVSGLVYDELYKRPCLWDPTPWLKRVKVLYLDVSISELRRRHMERGDELFDIARYSEVKQLYDAAILQNYECWYLPGEASHPAVLGLAQEAIQRWRNGWSSTAHGGSDATRAKQLT